MAEKFLVFEDAAKELKKSPDELKALVDEGKLRTFMDGGKMKFKQKDVEDLKKSLGIATDEDELTLAAPEELPEVPPMPAEEMAAPGAEAPEAPEIPPPAPVEDEFTIEPLDEEPDHRVTPSAGGAKGAAAKPAGAKAAAKAEGGGEEEVASLSDFEISEDVEDKGRELGDDEAELLSMQAPAFRSFEEAEPPNVLMTVVLVASTIVIALAAVAVMSFAWGVNISSLTSIWPAQ